MRAYAGGIDIFCRLLARRKTLYNELRRTGTRSGVMSNSMRDDSKRFSFVAIWAELQEVRYADGSSKSRRTACNLRWSIYQSCTSPRGGINTGKTVAFIACRARLPPIQRRSRLLPCITSRRQESGILRMRLSTRWWCNKVTSGG